MDRVEKKIGDDLSKWLITKKTGISGRWAVCPPINHDDPEWFNKGGLFDSGAEALAAYAAGADLAHMSARRAAEVVEPWHGQAVVR